MLKLYTDVVKEKDEMEEDVINDVVEEKVRPVIQTAPNLTIWQRKSDKFLVFFLFCMLSLLARYKLS